MTSDYCCNLYNDSNDEDTGRTQNAILSGKNFGDETRKEGSKPGSKLEDRSEPPLLCRVINVAVRLYLALMIVRRKSSRWGSRLPKDGIAKIPLNMPWLYP
jgi:hypothetical protein